MTYKYDNKATNISVSNRYTLAKTLAMFDYSNLPDSIPEQELERILQEKGIAFIYEYDSELYAFTGSLTGSKDMYNRFTEININVVKDNTIKTVKVDDGVLFLNDDYSLGLLPLVEKYNSLIIENEISLMMYNYNSRIQKIISASDDITKESAESYLKDIINGKLAVIGESKFLQDLKVQGGNITTGQSLTDLIEYNQYLKASLYNEIGIQANTNNKKERLITAEIEQNKELLYPLVNNMFTNRVKAVEELNNKYGLDVTVEYGSIWKYRNVKGVEDETSGMENEGRTTESNSEDEPTE